MRRGVLGPIVDAQRTRRLSAVDVTQRALDRIAAASELNAVIRVDAEAALSAADDVDRRRAADAANAPLAGVPVLVKDNMDVRGMPTTYGSLLCAGNAAAEADDIAVARLRAAGAIIVGKTNLSEFAMEAISDNMLYGATHNPWRTGFSPGGSSGGSAAALAAGLVPVATGTDGGGSVRIPASMCGLVGLKPTSGVTGARPARLPLELSSAGPLATTVADLRLLFELTSGPAPGDPSCVYGPDPAAAERPLDTVFATVRVAGTRGVDTVVEKVFTAAVEEFGRMTGRSIGWLPAGIVDAEADDTWEMIYAAEDVHAIGAEKLRAGYNELDPRVRRWVDRGLEAQIDDYLLARQARNTYTLQLDELLEPANVLLTPTVTAPGYPLAGPIEASGALMPIDLFNTAAMNLTGHPALSVPAGSAGEIPCGLQIVGPRGSDMWLIELAGRWERHRPWPLSAPNYESFLD